MRMAVLPAVAAARRNDGAGADELTRDRDRLVEEAAGVVAHVEDDAGEAAAGFPLEPADRLAQPLLRLLVEGGEAKIAGPPGKEARLHRIDMDDGARQRQLDRRLVAA